MTATFPAQSALFPQPTLYRYGQAMVAIAPYNGATDATSPIYLGSTGAKAQIHYDRQMHNIECQQMLGAVAGTVSGEKCELSFSFLEHNLANIKQLYGMGNSTNLYGGAAILSGGTLAAAGTLNVGDDQNTSFYQMLVQMRGMQAYPTKIRLYQFWKVAVASIGAIDPDKAGHDQVQVKFMVYADPVAAATTTKPSMFFIVDT